MNHKDNEHPLHEWLIGSITGAEGSKRMKVMHLNACSIVDSSCNNEKTDRQILINLEWLKGKISGTQAMEQNAAIDSI